MTSIIVERQGLPDGSFVELEHKETGWRFVHLKVSEEGTITGLFDSGPMPEVEARKYYKLYCDRIRKMDKSGKPIIIKFTKAPEPYARGMDAVTRVHYLELMPAEVEALFNVPKGRVMDFLNDRKHIEIETISEFDVANRWDEAKAHLKRKIKRGK